MFLCPSATHLFSFILHPPTSEENRPLSSILAGSLFLPFSVDSSINSNLLGGRKSAACVDRTAKYTSVVDSLENDRGFFDQALPG
jgi:hypothetical protein